MKAKVKLSRFLNPTNYKGEKNYLKNQRIYEIVKTVFLFLLSLSLFFGGLIATGKRENLLTIVAVLGCLPAAKSLVSVINFMRFKCIKNTLSDSISKKYKDLNINEICGLNSLYDLCFTSSDKSYKIDHIVVTNKTIIGISTDSKFDPSLFNTHICKHLKMSGIDNVTVKIFNTKKAYFERLSSVLLKESVNISDDDLKIISVIKNIII